MRAPLCKVSRRSFLQVAGATGLAGAAGLVLGFRPQSLFAAADADSAVFEPNTWLSIASDGTVRLICHRSEMGQGIRTAVPMLLAEELEVDWQDVVIVQAPGDPLYGDQNTDGSRSILSNWEPLRKAGAAARDMLIAAAAAQWSVPPGECMAEKSRVHHRGSGRSSSYGELAAAAAKLEVPADPQLKDPADFKIIGTSPTLVDLEDIVSGKATYGIDTRLPGMLYASVERSPTVGGKVVSFDADAALAVPGVRKVVELPARSQPDNTNNGIAVIGDNTWATFKGREALAAKWDAGEGPHESSAEQRTRMESIVAGEGKAARSEGDWAGAKAGAERVVAASYYGPYLVHAPMEPLACTAVVENGRCEVWAPTQDPQTARKQVAGVLGIAEDAVTVNVTLLGGGFGRKSKPDFILETVQVARAAGAPVKLTWSREDEVRHGFYRAENLQSLEATLDAENHITGWRQHTVFPTIMSTFMAGAKDPNPFELGMGFTNMPFRIPNVQLESSGVESDLRIGWLRSVCNTFHAFSSNCFVDQLAQEVGKDPVALRLELLGEPRKVFLGMRDRPYGLETGRLSHVIERAAQNGGWGRQLPNGQGLGFASHFSFLSYVAMVAHVEVDDAGELRVHQFDCVIDAGTVVHPDTVRAQIEGSVVFGLSMALYGKITVEDGVVQQSNFHDYPLLRIGEMPRVNVEIVESRELPAGVGEPGVPPVAPALSNAIYAATGKRIRDLPISGQSLA